MSKSPYLRLSKHRKSHHLNLNDVAYLLDMDQGNLSRFEARKSSNPKALLGYHCLFNLSIGDDILKDVIHNSKDIIHRCFKLLEILEEKPNTKKNRLRSKGINDIICRLVELQETYEEN
jgi:transcriptional regulator with XRE-family HTH domain